MGAAEFAGGKPQVAIGENEARPCFVPEGDEEASMRIAASADLHFSPQSYAKLKDQFERVRDDADVLVLAGDLTNYGQPDEMEPLLNVLVRLRLPTVVVLGNHDYESGKEQELVRMMTAAGIKVLDGSGYERDGVGFAGCKGFVGGFGRGVLTAFGEREIKDFVRASIDETMKLERGISQLRAPKRVVVLHGHAHHGRPDGQTRGGVPVHNVAISLLQAQTPSQVYRVFEL